MFGIYAVSELKADEGHVVGKIDKRDAYNQVKRGRILRRLYALPPYLRHYA